MLVTMRVNSVAQADVFYYIESSYNRRCRHSALGYLSPVVHEELL